MSEPSKFSEILEISKRRLGERKLLTKSTEVKAPDISEWQEDKRFLRLPQKAKESMIKNDVVEYDRLVGLGQKVWDEWQVWFMGQVRDAEHPFVNGLFIQRWKEPLETILGLERKKGGVR